MINLITEFIATNIIPLYMVWICVGIIIIGSMVSLGLPFIGFISIVIPFTILKDFLFDGKVISGYLISSTNEVITLVEYYDGLRIFCVILLLINCVTVAIGIMNKYMD